MEKEFLMRNSLKPDTNNSEVCLKKRIHFCNTIMLLPPDGVHRESSCKIVQMITVPSSAEIKAFFTL
jgi:hypothetical protein